MNDSPKAFGIKVRTLGEFVFCQRAGILSSLQETNDTEREYDQPNLDFLPQYSLAVVEEQLAIHLRRLGTRATLAVLLLVVGGVSFWFSWKIAVVAAAVLLFVLSRSFNRELRSVLTLADTRRQALQAEPVEPPSTLSSAVPVNWWSLLKSGFDSIRLQESLRDEETKLSGTPWRVLRKGSLRIPVIKLETANFEAGRFWVYPQHEIRLAAYAHLLATCEGGEVPYAIALFGDSFDGIAIPISAEAMRAIESQLDAAREAIRRHAASLPTDAPENTNVCSGCPFGCPRAVTEAARRDPSKKIHGVPARDGRSYHSECGDLFSWTPPHWLAKKKGLLPPNA